MRDAIPIDQIAQRDGGVSILPEDCDTIMPLLKLMSEPNRMRIYTLLARGEMCVCDIEAEVKLPQNLVSHHLGVLRDAGYIQARRKGRWVYYAVSRQALAAVYPALCRLFNPDCVSDVENTC